VIVVVGGPVWRAEDPGAAEGLAVGIAGAAAAVGATVQLVGKVGDDPEGDQLLLDLGRIGVGHAALLRDPAARTPLIAPSAADDGSEDALAAQPAGLPLDAADLELALRYLTDFLVVVVADPIGPEALRVAADAASFSGAHLVAVVPVGGPELELPPGATILEGPAGNDAAGFGALVGTYAAAIDRGVPPADAFGQAAIGVGLER
jgi:hypothetical protein